MMNSIVIALGVFLFLFAVLWLVKRRRPRVTQDDASVWVEFETAAPLLDLKCSACRIPIRTYSRLCPHCGSEREPSILVDGAHRGRCDKRASSEQVEGPESVVSSAA
jgi:hypothetical protein